MRAQIVVTILLGLLFLVAASDLQSTIYFVTTSGNDDSTGLSWEKAWLTINHACRSIDPGDTILVWSGNYPGTVTPTVSGDSVQRPCFIANGSNGIVTMKPGKFYFNSGINYWKIEGLDIDSSDGTGIYVDVGDHEPWFLEVNGCIIHRHAQKGIEFATGFTSAKIIGFEISGNTQSGIRMNDENGVGALVVDHCTIKENGEIGIYPGGLFDSLVVLDCDVSENGGCGIELDGAPPGRLIAKRSKFNLNDVKGIAYTHDFDGAYNSLIDSCQIINNYESGMDFKPSYSTVRWNYISRNGVRDIELGEGGDKGVSFYDANHCLVHNNVIKSSGGVELDFACDSSKFYNNTLIKDHAYTVAYGGEPRCVINRHRYEGKRGNQFKNNLIINYLRWGSDTTSHIRDLAIAAGWNSPPEDSTYTQQIWDYNLYWCPHASYPDSILCKPFYIGGQYRTLEWIKANYGAQEDSSIYVDPWFVSYADSNFNLVWRSNLNHSKAIDAGVDVGLPYNGLRPDIGAFEH